MLSNSLDQIISAKMHMLSPDTLLETLPDPAIEATIKSTLPIIQVMVIHSKSWKTCKINSVILNAHRIGPSPGSSSADTMYNICGHTSTPTPPHSHFSGKVQQDEVLIFLRTT
jgi:hypothetical protein